MMYRETIRPMTDEERQTIRNEFGDTNTRIGLSIGCGGFLALFGGTLVFVALGDTDSAMGVCHGVMLLALLGIEIAILSTVVEHFRSRRRARTAFGEVNVREIVVASRAAARVTVNGTPILVFAVDDDRLAAIPEDHVRLNYSSSIFGVFRLIQTERNRLRVSHRTIGQSWFRPMTVPAGVARRPELARAIAAGLFTGHLETLAVDDLTPVDVRRTSDKPGHPNPDALQAAVEVAINRSFGVGLLAKMLPPDRPPMIDDIVEVLYRHMPAVYGTADRETNERRELVHRVRRNLAVTLGVPEETIWASTRLDDLFPVRRRWLWWRRFQHQYGYLRVRVPTDIPRVTDEALVLVAVVGSIVVVGIAGSAGETTFWRPILGVAAIVLIAIGTRWAMVALWACRQFSFPNGVETVDDLVRAMGTGVLRWNRNPPEPPTRDQLFAVVQSRWDDPLASIDG